LGLIGWQRNRDTVSDLLSRAQPRRSFRIVILSAATAFFTYGTVSEFVIPSTATAFFQNCHPERSEGPAFPWNGKTVKPQGPYRARLPLVTETSYRMPL
jgi:hypothetical protein